VVNGRLKGAFGEDKKIVRGFSAVKESGELTGKLDNPLLLLVSYLNPQIMILQLPQR